MASRLHLPDGLCGVQGRGRWHREIRQDSDARAGGHPRGARHPRRHPSRCQRGTHLPLQARLLKDHRLGAHQRPGSGILLAQHGHGRTHHLWLLHQKRR